VYHNGTAKKDVTTQFRPSFGREVVAVMTSYPSLCAFFASSLRACFLSRRLIAIGKIRGTLLELVVNRTMLTRVGVSGSPQCLCWLGSGGLCLKLFGCIEKGLSAVCFLVVGLSGQHQLSLERSGKSLDVNRQFVCHERLLIPLMCFRSGTGCRLVGGIAKVCFCAFVSS